MEERMGEAFAGTKQLSVMGRRLHVGDPAPEFHLHYFDLADLAVRTLSLADLTGLARLLNVVNTLESPHCQQVIKQWETLRALFPPEACMYTVSVDPPQEQARWQDTAGVLHQILSAHGSDQFGLDYGVWIKERRQLAQAVFVLDRHDRIAYAEYVADQLHEPDYTGALQAV